MKTFCKDCQAYVSHGKNIDGKEVGRCHLKSITYSNGGKEPISTWPPTIATSGFWCFEGIPKTEGVSFRIS